MGVSAPSTCVCTRRTRLPCGSTFFFSFIDPKAVLVLGFLLERKSDAMQRRPTFRTIPLSLTRGLVESILRGGLGIGSFVDR